MEKWGKKFCDKIEPRVMGKSVRSIVQMIQPEVTR